MSAVTGWALEGAGKTSVEPMTAVVANAVVSRVTSAGLRAPPARSIAGGNPAARTGPTPPGCPPGCSPRLDPLPTVASTAARPGPGPCRYRGAGGRDPRPAAGGSPAAPPAP